MLLSLIQFHPKFLTLIHSTLLLFQSDDTLSADYPSIDPTVLWTIIGASLILSIFVIAGVWKVFEKAGQPGWASIIPIYNVIVMLKIAGKPTWWLLLLIIPFVNIIIAIMISIEIARNFGKDTGFGIGLALLGFIFYPILGFGNAQYRPYGNQYPPPPPPPYYGNQYPPPPPPPGYGNQYPPSGYGR